MKFRKITAIIRLDRAEQVERKLKSIGVPGMSCTDVNGYGEYADFYRSDWKVKHARVEIFVSADQAREIVDAILSEAGTGSSGDGIIAVLPVENLYHIRSGNEATDTEI
ncbi:MAG TPA: P-II family nitrogen regulator [Gammaproteobacteria bacterium]|nr:P-II family nitrogen regulator [Gammaproteobacteria bacterium]